MSNSHDNDPQSVQALGIAILIYLAMLSFVLWLSLKFPILLFPAIVSFPVSLYRFYKAFKRLRCKPPKYLYRYLSANFGLSSVEKLEFKIALPKDLNDPLEMFPTRPLGTVDTGPPILSESELLQMYHEHRAVSGEPFVDFATYKENQNQIYEAVRESALDNSIPADGRTLGAFKYMYSKIFGIMCFSERANSELMWAHYGDNHKGIAVEFSTRDYPEAKFSPVCYSNTRPRLDSSMTSNIKLLYNRLFEIWTTKSKEWKYEQEWRLFFPLLACQKIESNGRTHYFVNLPKTFISAIVLGARHSDADMNKAREIAQALSCALKKIVMKSDGYSLEVVTVSLPQGHHQI